VILGPFDKIGNDQEIAGKPHTDDHVQLEFKAVEIDFSLVIVRQAENRQPLFQPSQGVTAQLLDLSGKIACETGQDRISLGRRKGASLRHDQRVLQGFRNIGKQLLHHHRAFHPQMLGGFLAVIIFDIGGLRNALHRIMRFVEIGFGKTAGVGCDQRNIAVHGQRDQACFRRHFDRVFATGQFDIEPSRKILLQQGKIGFCRSLLLLRDQTGQRAFATTGQGDQASTVVAQKIHCDMGFQIGGPVQMGSGDQLAEIFIALRVLRE